MGDRTPAQRRSPGYILACVLLFVVCVVLRTCKHGRLDDLIRLFQPPPGASSLRVRAVPIEAVKPGDRVLARDPRSGRTVVAKVAARTRREVRILRVLELSSLEDGTLVIVRTTDDHRFWVPRLRTWVPAGRLRKGDLVGTGELPAYRVLSTRTEQLEEPVPVFNLVVPEVHSYFLVAGGKPTILVHNLDCIPPPIDSGSWRYVQPAPASDVLPPLDPPPVLYPPPVGEFRTATNPAVPHTDRASQVRRSLEESAQKAIELIGRLLSGEATREDSPYP